MLARDIGDGGGALRGQLVITNPRLDRPTFRQLALAVRVSGPDRSFLVAPTSIEPAVRARVYVHVRMRARGARALCHTSAQSPLRAVARTATNALRSVTRRAQCCVSARVHVRDVRVRR